MGFFIEHNPSAIWSGDRFEHLHFGERSWSGTDGFEVSVKSEGGLN